MVIDTTLVSRVGDLAEEVLNQALLRVQFELQHVRKRIDTLEMELNEARDCIADYERDVATIVSALDKLRRAA